MKSSAREEGAVAPVASHAHEGCPLLSRDNPVPTPSAQILPPAGSTMRVKVINACLLLRHEHGCPGKCGFCFPGGVSWRRQGLEGRSFERCYTNNEGWRGLNEEVSHSEMQKGRAASQENLRVLL